MVAGQATGGLQENCHRTHTHTDKHKEGQKALPSLSDEKSSSSSSRSGTDHCPVVISQPRAVAQGQKRVEVTD